MAELQTETDHTADYERRLLRLRGVGMSHIGRKRYSNQDRFFVSNSDEVYAVADGVGGLQHGEKASRMAIDSLRTALSYNPNFKMTDVLETMHIAVRLTSAQLTGKPNRLGTTFSCVRNLGQCCEIGHLGDSRIFILGDWGIDQLTEDHAVNYVPKQVKVANAPTDSRPDLTPRTRSYLSRYLGQIGEMKPLILNFRPAIGDAILICSDGISGAIPKEEIHAIIRAKDSSANAIRSLIATAESRGGSDNQTAVLIRCSAADTTMTQQG